MSNLYFTGLQQNILTANSQISSNLGLPFLNTLSWANPQSSYNNPLLWFFIMPDINGWTREDGAHFTYEQMISGVINVSESEYDPSWFPSLWPA